MKAKNLIRRKVHATDGNIGFVTNLYFDDDRWTVRYLVVDTGHWLPGRQVLISPFSVRRPAAGDRRLDTALTREQVKNSPDVNTERPISRQQEIAYSDYYGYPYYWAGPTLWGAAAVPMWPVEPSADRLRTTADERATVRAHNERNSHLRDLNHVTGYGIHASDGSIGHVDDFLVDDESWTIRYLVIDTSNWIGGRRVLIAPSWVRAIRWELSQFELALTRDAIYRSPEYDPDAEVDRSYEDRLHVHYAQPPYWTADRPHRSDVDPTGLTRLDETEHLEVADRDSDVRGWQLVAADGVPVGSVEHLIVDAATMRVPYLEVGLQPRYPEDRARDVLVPIEYVDLDKSARQVRLQRITSSRIDALPSLSGLPIEPQLLVETRAHFAGRSVDTPEPALRGERRPAAMRRR